MHDLLLYKPFLRVLPKYRAYSIDGTSFRILHLHLLEYKSPFGILFAEQKIKQILSTNFDITPVQVVYQIQTQKFVSPLYPDTDL